LAFVFCLLYTIEVVEVIIFGEENRLTIVATLNEVMWIGGNGKAWGTRHWSLS